MTAQTTIRPLPESATTDHTHPIPQPDTKPGRARRRRNDRGFSMLELLVGMVILGILGAIGYGIYTNFIGDARDTALDQNIQTAAAELQSVLALEPTLAGTPALVTAMTNRTNFVWDGTLWDFEAGDEPDTIRYQFLTSAIPAGTAVAHPTAVTAGTPPVAGKAPAAAWLVDDTSAVRIHLSNPEGEWRCALLVIKPQHDRHHRHHRRRRRRCDGGGVARYLVRRRVGCGDGRASRLLACRRPPWCRYHQHVSVRLRFRRCWGNVQLLAERCPDVGHPR